MSFVVCRKFKDVYSAVKSVFDKLKAFNKLTKKVLRFACVLFFLVFITCLWAFRCEFSLFD
jgi:hypothetical protein